MRFYDDLAEWWPLVDDPAGYAVEAGIYADLLAEAFDGPIESLLELGSGGGNNALHMKRRFPRLLLTDVSDGMLAVSRALNPSASTAWRYAHAACRSDLRTRCSCTTPSAT